MRRAVAGVAAVILLGAAGVVRHSVAQSTTTAPGEAGETTAQRTSSAGTTPSLEGRWLALTTVGIAGGVHRSSASLWEVTRGADGIVLNERHVMLPEPQRAMADRADWNPTAPDLAPIAAAWETLPADPRGLARMEHEILGRDGLPPDVAGEPMVAGALWVVRQTYLFAPGRSRPVKEVRVLAAETEAPAGYRGKFLTVVLAAAPLPIPIKIPGSFRLIRLPAPARSIWTRIADAFRGCN